LRDTAREHITRLRVLIDVLEAHGHAVQMVWDTHIGYVTYEDDVQVVAEPFRDTDAGPSR